MGLAAAFLVLGTAHMARAERIVFQRGETLFVTSDDGKETPRRLFSLTRAGETVSGWAAAPDGQRIAWLARRPNTTLDGTPNLDTSPAVVRVCDLAGRHEKKLFDTKTLRNRLGKRVTQLGSEYATFAYWDAASLSWSADSRTIYLSCVSSVTPSAKATFTADAASGFAVVDADERWRSLVPATFLDARPRLLAGSGQMPLGTVDSNNPAAAPDTGYAPVVLFNLAQGTRTPLFTLTDGKTDLPDYAFAGWCALSPDASRVAFVTQKQNLWLVDAKTQAYRRLAESGTGRPRWASANRLLFLQPRGDNKPGSDLYEIVFFPAPAPGEGGDDIIAPIPAPQLVLANVDAFDVLSGD